MEDIKNPTLEIDSNIEVSSIQEALEDTSDQ